MGDGDERDEQVDGVGGGRGGPRWGRRILVAVGVFVGIAALCAGAFLFFTRNPDPDAFYDPPQDLSAPPGTILRSEPFDHGLPAGSKGWRILYVSTDEHGDHIAVSGLVIAPIARSSRPRPVLAWAHGTLGLARSCAPSNTEKPLASIPDLRGAVAAGWVITLTDYPGLGTPGPHPYLVLQSEGRAVLDSVTAAHQLDTGLDLQDRYAIWGHSQGGHAALAAGQLAPQYLPDQELVGVAALAPATDLAADLAAVRGTTAGNFLTVLAVQAWSAYYDDIPAGTLTRAARVPARTLARTCLNQPSRFRIAVAGLALPDEVLALDPEEDPAWRAHLAANEPDPTGIDAPLFVGQGDADEIIDPEVTEAWVAARCEAGGPTTWRSYPGVDHLAVVEGGGDDAMTWTLDRFAGEDQVDACPAA